MFLPPLLSLWLAAHAPIHQDLRSVRPPAEFAQAGGELVRSGRTEREGGIEDAYKYMLGRHVKADGTVDLTALPKAVQHRDMMPLSRELAPGAVWQELGPKNYGGSTLRGVGIPPQNGCAVCVAYAPSQPATLYVGAMDGGVWKSADSGAHWTPLSDTWPHMGVSALAVDPKDPNTVYAGAGNFLYLFYNYGGGVMKSTDGGSTWHSYGTAQFGNDVVDSIVVDPKNSNIVTAGVTGADSTQTGIFRSTDSGQTWTQVQVTGSINVIDIDPAGKYWASGVNSTEWSYGALILLTSTNQGLTWTPAPSVPPAGSQSRDFYVASSRQTSGTVYAVVPDDESVWKTTTGGTSWNRINSNASGFPVYLTDGPSNWAQGWYDCYIKTAVVPSTKADAVIVGLITVAVSNDGGASWTDISQSYDPNNATAHPDQHGFCLNPTKPQEFLLANDGGVYRVNADTGYNSFTFAPLNANLAITQIYQLAVHPTNPLYVLAGLQDDGTADSRSNFSAWSEAYTGDGGFSAYDVTHHLQYAEAAPYLEFVAQEALGTSNATNIAGGLSGYAVFLGPLAYGQFSNLFYAGADQVFRWDRTQWQGSQVEKHNGIVNDAYTAMEISPANENIMYAGSYFGGLWASSDAGLTWTEVDTGANQNLPDGVITEISSSPLNPSDILVTVGGTGHGHLMHCTNAFASNATRQWLVADGSGTTALPNITTNSVVRDPNSPATKWYIADDAGVFVTADAGAHWANMGSPQGLPDTLAEDLKVDTHNGYLFCATYGRGAWRIPLSVTPAFTSVQVVPNKVPSGIATVGWLSANGIVPSGGLAVNLSSSNSSLVKVPASATIPAAQPWSSFPITIGSVNALTNVTLTATSGSITKTALVQLEPVKIAKLVSPTAVISGNTANCTVYLNAKAPSTGTTVNLSVGSPLSGTTPVTVPAGAIYKTFSIKCADIASGSTPNVSVSANGSNQTNPVSVKPADIYEVGAPSAVVDNGFPSVKGGSPIQIEVLLNGLAPPSTGASIAITTSNNGVIPPPSVNALIAAGNRAKSFYLNTKTVGVKTAVTVRGTYSGKFAQVTVYVLP